MVSKVCVAVEIHADVGDFGTALSAEVGDAQVVAIQRMLGVVGLSEVEAVIPADEPSERGDCAVQTASIQTGHVCDDGQERLTASIRLGAKVAGHRHVVDIRDAGQNRVLRPSRSRCKVLKVANLVVAEERSRVWCLDEAADGHHQTHSEKRGCRIIESHRVEVGVALCECALVASNPHI